MGLFIAATIVNLCVIARYFLFSKPAYPTELKLCAVIGMMTISLSGINLYGPKFSDHGLPLGLRIVAAVLTIGAALFPTGVVIHMIIMDHFRRLQADRQG